MDADRLDELVDDVLAEFAVEVEEDLAVANGEFGVSLEVPDVLQVVVVQQVNRVATWKET